MENNGKQMVSSKNKKAVDWKIFEIQSLLISEDADLGTINDSLLWLQPKHYLEVIEERVNDDRCGYPLCTCSIVKKKGMYRIDYHNQKVYTMDQSHLYCSTSCIEKSQILEMRYDGSSPYSRSVVDSLDITSTQKSGIDDILTLLGPEANSHIKSTKNVKNNEVLQLSSTSFHGSVVMEENGEVLVDFQEGIPVVIPNTIINNSNNLAVATSISPLFEKIKNKPMQSLSVDRNQEVIDLEYLHDNDDQPFSAQTTAIHPTKSIVYHPKTKQQNIPLNTKTEVSVDEILATMNELQAKYKLKDKKSNNLSERSTSDVDVTRDRSASIQRNRFINGSLLRDSNKSISEETNISANTKKAPHSQSTLRSGDQGSRAGAKSVSWDSVIEHNHPPSPSPQPLKPLKSIPMQFEIKERVNPRVMSEAAMMLKQEVVVLSTPNESNSSLGVDNTTNASIPSTATIEGYIMQSKDRIRVAPITTIQNLSYFPFPSQKKDTDSISDMDEVIEEEIEQLSIAESVSSSDTIIDDSNDVAVIPQEPLKSLFFSVWSTMDELFAYSYGIFDDDYCADNIINITADDNGSLNQPNYENITEDSITAIDSSGEQNSGVIKLLTRGILTAEKRFELLQRHLLSNSERDRYLKTKKKLISSTYKLLRKSLVSSVYSPQTASTLPSFGWTLIGILVIDAILKKKHLGPFFGTNNNTTTSNSSISNGEEHILHQNNVGISNWSSIVDRLASDVVGTSALRKDDLRILRSYFEVL